MGIIPQGISQLSETVLSYTVLALTILAIVKLIQTFTGGKGLGGLFGKGGKDGNTTTTPDGKTTTTTTPDGKTKTPKENLTPEQKAAERVIKQQFDPNNPGYVKFLVSDEDDNPVKGATILVKPRYAAKNKYMLLPAIRPFKRTLNENYRQYLLHTNADGYAPSRADFERIGSGVVEVKVSHPEYRMPRLLFTPTFQIEPQTKRMIIITMKGAGEAEERINPYIHELNGDTNKLIMKGEIK